MQLEQLLLTLSADIARLESKMSDAARTVDRRCEEMERRVRDANQVFENFGTSIGNGIRRGSQIAQFALAGLIAYSIHAASRANEVGEQLHRAFGEGADEAERFADALSGRTGRSVVDLQQRMTGLRDQLEGLGVTGETAMRLVQGAVERSLDLAASTPGLTDARAFTAVQSAIMGQVGALRSYGVAITAASVRQELLTEGFTRSTARASDGAKAIARYNVFIGQTGDLSGEAERDIDKVEGATERARAQFEQAAITLGRQLLPHVARLATMVADAATRFNQLSPEIQAATVAALALAAVAGPMIGLISTVLQAAVAYRTLAAGIAAARAAEAAGAIGGAGGRRGPGLLPIAGRLAVGAGIAYTAREALNAGDDTRAYLRALETASTSQRTQGASRDRLGEALRVLRERVSENATDRQSAGLLTRIEGEFGRRGLSIPSRNARPVTMADLNLLEAQSAAQRVATPADLLIPTGTDPTRRGSRPRTARPPRDTSAQDAERERRRLQGVDDAIYQAQLRELGFQNNHLRDLEDRFNFDQVRIDMERERRRVELDALETEYRISNGKEGYSALERQRIETAEDAARVEERTLLRAEFNLAQQDERAQFDRQLTDLAAELVGLERDGVRTAADRRRVELSLLALSREAERKAMERRFIEERTPEADRVAQRAVFGQITEGLARNIERDTLSPLAAWRDQALVSAAQIDEALERAAAGGLDRFTEGLVQAGLEFQSLEAFAESLGTTVLGVLKDIAAEMLQLAIRRQIADAIGGSLGSFGGGGGHEGAHSVGGGGGGFGGFLSSAANVLRRIPLPGRAAGGYSLAGMPIRVGEFGEEGFIPHVDGTVISNQLLRSLQSPRMPTMPALNVQVNTHTTTPLRVEQNQEGGVSRIDIYETAGRDMIAAAGSRGDLARAARLTPQPFRRG